MLIDRETIYQYRFVASQLLRKAARKIYPKRLGAPLDIIYDLGKNELPQNAKKALICYAAAAIRHKIEGKLDQFDLNKHTIRWESLEMIRILNSHGYVVDYVDPLDYPLIDYEKYDVIIDGADHLKDVKPREGQSKIYFPTNNHWLKWNIAELERIRMFYERTGIMIPWSRQLPPITSDEYADYLTYFGTDLQKDSFSKKPKKVQLNISSCCVPKYKKKDIRQARKRFLWISGGGFLHKGLDIAVEAFAKLPDSELFIVANLREKNEQRFWDWIKPIMAERPNIHEVGWMDLTSPAFNEVADQCMGVVYTSGACGGPGSVARVLHNGLIPIVTPTGFVRAEILGYNVDGKTDKELIDSTVSRVKQVMDLPESELEERSDAVRDFAKKYHTRAAFSESFEQLIRLIEQK